MKTILETYFYSDSKLLAILIDPDKHTNDSLIQLIKKADKSKIDLIFVGSSLSGKNYTETIDSIKKISSKPCILFPGNALQLSPNADALLNLSLISGRNPELLIGEHVKSALYVKNSGIEVIPTGYMLIESGRKTSVEYISNTTPIPRDKTDIAVSTAIAGEFLGLRVIYLDAGSGAQQTIPNQMIKGIKNNTNLPLICGGGIRSSKEIQEKWDAGANIVVIGNAFEDNPNFINEL